MKRLCKLCGRRPPRTRRAIGEDLARLVSSAKADAPDGSPSYALGAIGSGAAVLAIELRLGCCDTCALLHHLDQKDGAKGPADGTASIEAAA